MVRASTNAITLPHVAVGAHMDNFKLLQGDTKYLLSAKQYHDFVITAYESAKNYSSKKYINDRDQYVVMKFDKDLIDIDMMYVPILEPSQLESLMIFPESWSTCNAHGIKTSFTMNWKTMWYTQSIIVLSMNS